MKKRKAKYYIVRCNGAGVFMAQVVSRKGTEAVLKDSRRLWRWSGAASLSQLAVEGVKNPGDCKFPVAVSGQTVFNIIEMIPVSPEAKKSIDGVPVWKA